MNRTVIRALLVAALFLATVASVAEVSPRPAASLAAPMAEPSAGATGPVPALLFRRIL